MENQFLVYQSMPCPDEQFVCCIGGRVLCAVRYLREDPADSTLFSFLNRCKIRYQPLSKTQMEDPWFYQPLEILTGRGNPVFSREGVQEFDGFLRGMGLRIARVEIPSPSGLWEVIGSSFARREVLILNIDQYYHPKSEKYHRQRYAWHALLLKGLCPETREVLVSDSAHGKEYSLPFDTVCEMCIGSGYLIGRSSQPPLPLPPEIRLSWEEQFSNPVSLFLKEMEETLPRLIHKEDISFFSYGYCYTVKYTVIPFLKMALREREGQEDWNGELLRWERLSRLLMKMALSGKNISEKICPLLHSQ